MEKVKRGNEIRLLTENRVGVLSEITSLISEAEINIENICAYGVGDQSLFFILTDDNERTGKILSERGYNIEERDVIILQLENRPGALSKVAQKLKEEGINIHYIYGTASRKGESTTIVFSSDNNDKAEEVLKFVLSLSYWKK